MNLTEKYQKRRKLNKKFKSVVKQYKKYLKNDMKFKGLEQSIGDRIIDIIAVVLIIMGFIGIFIVLTIIYFSNRVCFVNWILYSFIAFFVGLIVLYIKDNTKKQKQRQNDLKRVRYDSWKKAISETVAESERIVFFSHVMDSDEYTALYKRVIMIITNMIFIIFAIIYLPGSNDIKKYTLGWKVILYSLVFFANVFMNLMLNLCDKKIRECYYIDVLKRDYILEVLAKQK